MNGKITTGFKNKEPSLKRKKNIERRWLACSFPMCITSAFASKLVVQIGKQSLLFYELM